MPRRLTLILATSLLFACGGQGQPNTDAGSIDGSGDISIDGSGDISVDGSGDIGVDGSGDIGVDVPPPLCDPAKTTYHRDVRPLVVSSCNDCHSPIAGKVYAGENYDWTLYTDPSPTDALIQGVQTWSGAMVSAVENDTMPPWPMADGCRDVEHSRALSPAQIKVFTDWRDNAYCEGEEAEFVDPGWTPPDNDHTDADITTASAEPWTLPASITQEDAFRCYQLDASFSEDTWVRAYATSPDTPMSHHALMYVIAPEDVSKVQSLDDAFDGPGWGDCDSGIGVNGSVVSGWVPGGGKMTYPEGNALLIAKGSVLVMQMHYSGVGATEEDLKQNTDQTQLHLWTLPKGESPSRRVFLKPWSDHKFEVPLGSTQQVGATENGPPAGAQILGIIPHMHNLGNAIRLELDHKDGSSACLARIGFDAQHQVCGIDGNGICGMWDFDWQLVYRYAADDVVEVQEGDKVSITCNYPYTDAWVAQSLGKDAPSAKDCSKNKDCPSNSCTEGKCTNPDPLKWGEASYEEMCIAYLFYSIPYSEGATFEACGAGCDGDANCLLDCILAFEGPTCPIVDQLQSCGSAQCGAQAQALNQCLNDCDLGGALSCIRNSQTPPPCWDAYESFIDCTWAAIQAGNCTSPACL